jgi:hypothetical protein
VIAFLTLFLGLVHGPITVALSAPPEVARIELLVDGAKTVDLAPPWQARIDLGAELAPHELLAVAYGRSGERLGEARQWVNRPRPRAEASFVLERDRDGRAVSARLVWRCLARQRPRKVSVTFDGFPVETTDLSRIAVPPHAPSVSHLLLADLDFGGGVTATAVAGFGGQQRDETDRLLTAFPVRLAGEARLPGSAGLAGWFSAAGRPLAVAAVEEGPAEVLFVLAGDARKDLDRLWRKDVWPWPWPRPRPLSLPRTTRWSFVETRPEIVRDQGGPTRLFRASVARPEGTGNFLQASRDLRLPDETGAPPSIAESVAVSALDASARERRRATVLLLGEGARDEGPLDAARVRRFLGRIRVPLHVWRISGAELPAAGEWPETVDATTIEGLGRAFEALRADLASQRIVWLEGRHDPSAISLTEKATDVLGMR